MQAAWGVHNLVNETMASAARVHIAEKGQTARNLTLVGFGGAGPVHAIGLARKLGCPRVVIPPLPGVMSAFGLLTAPMAIERPRAVRQLLRNVDLKQLEQWSKELEKETAALLPAGSRINFMRVADIWRVGQDYPLEIEIKGAWTARGALGKIEVAFDKEYAVHYGRVDDDTPLEVVTLRVKAWQSTAIPAVKPGKKTATVKPKGKRRLYVPSAGGYEQAPVYDRKALGPGSSVRGPAIIEERESTTVIDRGDKLTVDKFGCLVVTLASQEARK
jgi:N-methylhydantoinase A/oxoprolinase/acetone carboxylase beta subunit